jgi:hypothetical protein
VKESHIVSTASDAFPGASPAVFKSSRRLRLILWLLLAIAPVVIGAMALKTRWEGFREEGIDHDRNAAEHARVAVVCRQQSEGYARSAEALEKSAEGFDHDFLLGPLLVAAEERRDEADAHEQEVFHLKMAAEEKQLADLARKAW